MPHTLALLLVVIFANALSTNAHSTNNNNCNLSGNYFPQQLPSGSNNICNLPGNYPQQLPIIGANPCLNQTISCNECIKHPRKIYCKRCLKHAGNIYCTQCKNKSCICRIHCTKHTCFRPNQPYYPNYPYYPNNPGYPNYPNYPHYPPSYNQGSGFVPGLITGTLIGAGGSLIGSAATTLRNPLVSGASFAMPNQAPARGLPPPIGHGLTPLPPNPGMTGPPTLIPWNNGTAGNPYSQPTSEVVAPANQIDLPNNKISLPVDNSSAMPPGALNKQIAGFVPHAPSTPGQDPGILRPPSFNNGSQGPSAGQNQQSAAALGSIDQNGQIQGSAPIKRPVRQSSNDFGLNNDVAGYRAKFTNNNNGQSSFLKWEPQKGAKTNDFGIGVKGEALANNTNGKKAQISYDSPRPAQYPGQGKDGPVNQNASGNHNKNFASAQVTNDLYGIPMVNPNKISTDANGQVSRGGQKPITTIANY